MKKVNVLDKGYVILHDTLGNDLTVANAARVSYDKKKEQMDEKDERLIKFLAREGHTSPFRHATLQFEVYAPLMVARQHWKYKNSTHETLQIVTIYAPGENKELVKKENKKWTHRRELVLVEK